MKISLGGMKRNYEVRMDPVMGLTKVLGPGLFREQAHHQFSRTENTSYSCLVVVNVPILLFDTDVSLDTINVPSVPTAP